MCYYINKINLKISSFEQKFKIIQEETKKRSIKHTIFDFNLSEIKNKMTTENDKMAHEEKFMPNLFEDINTEWFYVKVLFVKILGCMCCRSERSNAVKRFDKIKAEIEEKLDINNYFEYMLNFLLLRNIMLDQSQIRNIENIKKKLISNN